MIITTDYFELKILYVTKDIFFINDRKYKTILAWTENNTWRLNWHFVQLARCFCCSRPCEKNFTYMVEAAKKIGRHLLFFKTFKLIFLYVAKLLWNFLQNQMRPSAFKVMLIKLNNPIKQNYLKATWWGGTIKLMIESSI